MAADALPGATNVRIVTDSSACLPRDLAARYRIIVVPLGLHIDGELIADGALEPDELYARVRAARRLPATTSPAPGEFLEAFRAARDEGATAVLCLTLSARFSGTYSAARTARDLAVTELPGLDVRAEDTGGLAMTHGFAVLSAARALEAGVSVTQAAEAARHTARRGHLAGALDTTRYLARGGRLPWVAHWTASLLRVKPLLAVSDGHAKGIGRARTSRRADERLLRYVEEQRAPGRPLHVAVMQADACERAEELAALVRERFQPVELLVTTFTPVMAVHTGPGFVGLAFYCDE
jgi:DegV family protein with EDD domain